MKTLKAVLVVVCLLNAMAMIPAGHPDKETAQECMAENDITEDEMNSVVLKFMDLHHKGQKEELLAEIEQIDQKYKCFTYCLMDKSGFTDENGRLSVDKLMESDSFPKEDEAIVLSCKEQHDSMADNCEYVFEMAKCIKDAKGE